MQNHEAQITHRPLKGWRIGALVASEHGTRCTYMLKVHMAFWWLVAEFTGRMEARISEKWSTIPLLDIWSLGVYITSTVSRLVAF